MAAADVGLAVDQGRRAFDVNEIAGDGASPYAPPLCRIQTIERGAVRLVHAVAKNKPTLERARTAYGRTSRVPGPKRARPGVRSCRKAREDSAVERPKPRNVEPIIQREWRGDVVLPGLERPEHRGCSGPGLAV